MRKRKLKVILGQINPIVGDIENNMSKIIEVINTHQDADLIIFPEMALVGYPLMDHIHDPLIQSKNLQALEKLKVINSKPAIILGTFTKPSKLQYKFQPFYNSAITIEKNKIIHIEHKRLLPNYDVFDERRYFSFDNQFKPISLRGVQIGILICEDLWDYHYETKVAERLVNNGAEILISINASPYYINKFALRADLIKSKAKKLAVPIVYVNMVGGLDEIVYDGQSFVCDSSGEIIYKAAAFQEDSPSVEVLIGQIGQEKSINTYELLTNWREEVVNALKLNLYDYFYKSGIFKGVVLGLSGGIDSAFTSYICATALDPKEVFNIMMPTKFTSLESLDLARQLCENLGSNYIIHPIDAIYEGFEESLEKEMGTLPFDVADENLQARIRANILMYYSNKNNWLVVSTGNKSEIGVGYCTLYGDTCGGKNIPGDLLKVQIYEICEWINREQEIIPKGIIERPPTAELREDQKDEDSLPPYSVLDQILKEIIDHGIGREVEHLQEKGIDLDTIMKVRRLYLNSEYKRRQLVQTIKISPSAFGVGRRYPVLKRLKF